MPDFNPSSTLRTVGNSFRLSSEAALHELLGITDPYNSCIAYAPRSKSPPHCTRRIKGFKPQKVELLVSDLLTTRIPSTRAGRLLDELSSCVVCGKVWWHQPQAKEIYNGWLGKLWIAYLSANGIDPSRSSRPPLQLSSVSWEQGLAQARAEQEATSDSSSESDYEHSYQHESTQQGTPEEAEINEASNASPSHIIRTRISDNQTAPEPQPVPVPTRQFPVRTFDVYRDPGPSTRAEPSSNPGENVIVTVNNNALQTLDPNLALSAARENTLDPTASDRDRADSNSSRASQQTERPPVLPSGATPCRSSGQTRTPSQEAAALVGSTSGGESASVDHPSNSIPNPALGATTSEGGSTEAADEGQSSTNDQQPTSSSSVERPDNHPNNSTPNLASDATTSEGGSTNAADESQSSTNDQQPTSSSSAERPDTERSDPTNDEEPHINPTTEVNDEVDFPEDLLRLSQLADPTDAPRTPRPSPPPPEAPVQVNGFCIYPQMAPLQLTTTVFNLLTQTVARKDRRAGYIYAYSRPSQPGFLKIGYTEAKTVVGQLPTPDPVRSRLRVWAAGCGAPVIEELRVYIPCAVGRIERLVHRTLQEFRRIEDPPCVQCNARARMRGRNGGQHNEWFQLDLSAVKPVLDLWRRFSEERPYDRFGRLVDFWSEVVDRDRTRGGFGSFVVDWLRKLPSLIQQLRRDVFRHLIGDFRGLYLA